jgi:hypothetical protein
MKSLGRWGLTLLAALALAGVSASLGASPTTTTSSSNLVIGEQGRSLAVSGARLYVGAPGAASDASSVGRLLAYNALSGVRLRVVGSPAGAVHDGFGAAVASGRGVVAVGAPLFDGGASRAGAVHLLDGNLLTPLRSVTSPQATADGAFGSAVAVLPVVGRVAVAAAGEQHGLGRVYLLETSTGDVTAVVDNPDTSGRTYFGAALAAYGDQLLVSAVNAHGVTDGEWGAVYRVDALSGAIEAAMVSPDTAAGGFGAAVTTVADLVAVGAPGTTWHGAPMGSVFVYDPEDGELVRRLDNPMTGVASRFGQAMAGDDTHLYVGDPRANVGLCFLCGAVQVIDPLDGSWVGMTAAPVGSNTSGYGAAVAVFGDRVFAGAPGAPPSGNLGSGVVYRGRVRHDGNTCGARADLTLDGHTWMADVQCAYMTLMWYVGYAYSEPAACAARGPVCVDVNCDDVISGGDLSNVVYASQYGDFPAVIDANLDGVIDRCTLPLSEPSLPTALRRAMSQSL